MTAPILITGGTGTLGRHVTPLLLTSGNTLRLLSRRPHEPAGGIEHVTGDLLTGEGVEAAVSGSEVVVHLARAAKGDEEATRNLVRAATAAGVRHLVQISVIGADRVPLSWFRSQLGAERVVEESGLPWTRVRAAQFHDLVLATVRAMTKLPVVPVPGGLRFQPVDARDVAARLAQLALGDPAGAVPDLAGPRVYGIDELCRSYMQARGIRRLSMPVRIPGKAGRAYRAGLNLTLDGADHGRRTWEDFLGERLSASRP